MITQTGIPFVMTEFLSDLQNIGKRTEPPDIGSDKDVGSKLIGYLVDGHYVTVGRLQHYIRNYGGKSLEFVKAVV